MTWFYVDDKFGESTKVKSIPRGQRMAAVGLWTMAGQWAAGQLKDGKVPAYMVEELGGSVRLAEILVASGLWEKDGEGYVFHDWADWQQTREQVEKKRADARSRMAKLRGGSREVRANSGVTSPEVRDVFATPIPSLPIPTSSTKKNAAKPKTDLPEGWTPNGKHIEKARGLGLDVAFLAEQFANHHAARGNQFVDWDRAFFTWIGNAPTFGGGRPQLRAVVNDGRPEGW